MAGSRSLPRRLQIGVATALLLAALAASAEAVTITHTFLGPTDGSGRRAWANFTQTTTGGNITIVLGNISPNDVNGAGAVDADTFILTGLLFNLSGQTVAAGKVSANISNMVNSSGTITGTPSFAYSCSTATAGPCSNAPPTSTSSTNIGGEWGYLFNSAGVATGNGITQRNMISTDGYGATGWAPDSTGVVRFDTSQNLNMNANPVDINWGFTSFGDNTVTNTDLGSEAYIKSAGTFIISVPAGFTLGAVTDVRFQYGGSFGVTHLDGAETTPLPPNLLLVSFGLAGALLEVRRRRKAAGGAQAPRRSSSACPPASRWAP